MKEQDDQLDNLSVSMGNLKNMSKQIGIEVDEQAMWVFPYIHVNYIMCHFTNYQANEFLFFRMLDEFGHEMDHTQSKMENTVNKMAKIMRLTNGKCLFNNKYAWLL